MKPLALAAAVALAGCSRPEPSAQTSAPAAPSATAAPPAAAPAGIERLEVFPILKAPSTPGNPHSLKVCVVLYDAQDRATAAEGEFTVTGRLVNTGAKVYAPMFAPLTLGGAEAAAAICPAASEIWPQVMAELKGTTHGVEVSFKPASGKTVSGAAQQAF